MTPIASISLGAVRSFCVCGKHYGMHDWAKIELQDGLLVVMENICQEEYLHCVPWQSDVTEWKDTLISPFGARKKD